MTPERTHNPDTTPETNPEDPSADPVPEPVRAEPLAADADDVIDAVFGYPDTRGDGPDIDADAPAP